MRGHDACVSCYCHWSCFYLWPSVYLSSSRHYFSGSCPTVILLSIISVLLFTFYTSCNCGYCLSFSVNSCSFCYWPSVTFGTRLFPGVICWNLLCLNSPPTDDSFIVRSSWRGLETIHYGFCATLKSSCPFLWRVSVVRLRDVVACLTPAPSSGHLLLMPSEHALSLSL